MLEGVSPCQPRGDSRLQLHVGQDVRLDEDAHMNFTPFAGALPPGLVCELQLHCCCF